MNPHRKQPDNDSQHSPHLFLGADASVQSSRLGAAVDLLHIRGAVALLVVRLAVELLAAGAGVQDIVLIGKGVAKFTREGVIISLVSFREEPE